MKNTVLDHAKILCTHTTHATHATHVNISTHAKTL